MRIRLQKDLEKLTEQVISLAALVEEQVRMAMKALESRDPALSKRVIECDLRIDHMEVDVEEECLKILALHQPVADHLRYIVAILKMNNDLERIGDLAVNIAERAEFISRQEPIPVPYDYFAMAQNAQEMLTKALDALVNRDLALAYRVCAQDDEVDAMKMELQEQFIKEIRKSQTNMESLLNLLFVSRHLERVADHATNIAEDVIYMISGDIHRHRGPGFEIEHD